MKHHRLLFFALIFLLAALLACSVDVELTPTPNPDGTMPETGGNQPPGKATESKPQGSSPSNSGGNGDILYFPMLPVEVIPTEGSFNIISANGLKSMSGYDIIVVLENTSTNPLDIITTFEWTLDVLAADGSVLSTNASESEAGLPPGQVGVLRAFPSNWEGDADHFKLSFKPQIRFIQDDMKSVFTNLALPKPIFTVEAQPFELLNETFFESPVRRTKAHAVVHNPNPGKSDIAVYGIYYDENNTMVGFAHWQHEAIPENGDLELDLESLPYLCGNPVRADYYAFMQDAYYMEELFKMW